MINKIGLQLYSLREELEQDFAGTMRKVRKMGYTAVETYGFSGTSSKEAAVLFQDLGLTVTGAHADLPLGDNKNKVLDMMGMYEAKWLLCPYLPSDQFTSEDNVRRLCDRLNESDAIARANGLSFAYHNHWFEYEPVDGRLAYEIMLEELEPTIFFELDTYWIRTAGIDPVTIVKQMGSRAPLLHIKDGPATIKGDMVALGEGIIDIPAILDASGDNAEWLIAELDRCATDMLTAVDKSYQYLAKTLS